MDKRLLKDLPYFIDFKHTGNIKVYHSLLPKYCPKRLHFSHHGMIARSQLDVLHFNSIVNAEQAYTEGKTPHFKLQFSKVSQCSVVKPVQEVPENAYLEDLMSEIIEVPEREPNLEKPLKRKSYSSKERVFP